MSGLGLALAVAVTGGVGAALRFVFDGFLRSRVATTFPIGTMIINLTGSLLLGLVTGLALNALVAPAWGIVLGTGLLGGYTTFSTASYETVRLAQARRYRAAMANGLGMLVGAAIAAWLGLWLGGLFS